MLHALAPIRTIAPADRPVTVDALKQHLRVDHTDDDVLIEAYLDAVVSHLDGWSGILGRCLVAQTWAQPFGGFPCGRLLRPGLADLIGVTSVTYRDADDVERTLDAANYHVVRDALGPVLALKSGLSWPSTYDRPDAVMLTASYGYGAISEDGTNPVPPAILAAIKLMVGDLYANRQSSVVGTVAAEIKMSTTVDALLAPFRRAIL